MILKLLTSSFFLWVLLSGCSSSSYSFVSSKKDDALLSAKEQEFEKELKEIFKEIDNSKESIRTVEEKQKTENRVVEKADSNGYDSFFRKSVLQRFKNEE